VSRLIRHCASNLARDAAVLYDAVRPCPKEAAIQTLRGIG